MQNCFKCLFTSNLSYHIIALTSLINFYSAAKNSANCRMVKLSDPLLTNSLIFCIPFFTGNFLACLRTSREQNFYLPVCANQARNNLRRFGNLFSAFKNSSSNLPYFKDFTCFLWSTPNC